MASIPIYAMQTTLLPQKISHQIDSMSCKFSQRRGYHTVNWETVTLLRVVRGLGMPSTRHQNRAILMNQACRLYTNPNMLWAKVLKAKYFPHTTLFTCNCNARGSHIWKSFLLGLQDLREGMSWIVGNGNTICIWTDFWLPHGSLRSYIEGPINLHEEDRTVSSLRLSHSWNFEALDFPLSTHLKNIIQGTLVAHFTSLEDTFLWP